MSEHPGKLALEMIILGLEGVTLGPWYEGDHWVFVPPSSGVPEHPLENILDRNKPQENAAHIARCDPGTIRSIAAYVSDLEARLELRDATIALLDIDLSDLRARLEKAEATLMRLSAHWPFTDPGRRRAKIVHIPSCAFDFIEDQLRALKDKS